MRIEASVVAVLLLAGTGWALWGNSNAIDWQAPTDAACSGAETGRLACLFVADGLGAPVALTHAPDGRLLVAQQDGRIVFLENGTAAATPFLDVSDRISHCHFEQGLLGLALGPDGRAYVSYTAAAPCDSDERFEKGDLVLARYAVQGGVADPASEEVLLRVEEPFRNHNGGQVGFGPDGMLYLGVGDGGTAGRGGSPYDPLGTGQDPSDWLGSILRIDVSGAAGYTVPADNPFVAGGGAPEVWAYGLRNPWRFAFDDAGGLWVADVGQNCFEEVSYVPPGTSGANLGWSLHEGAHRLEVSQCGARSQPDPDLVFPLYEYAHNTGGCSVTGGVVAPADWGDLAGRFLFSDFCTGTVSAIGTDGTVETLLETGLQVTGFALDDGDVYLLHWGGSVQRLQPV